MNAPSTSNMKSTEPVQAFGGLPERAQKILTDRFTQSSPQMANPWGKDDGQRTWMGLPYRGPVYDYKKDDPEHRKPQLKYDARVKQFNLNDDEHIKAYEKLAQALCSGRAVVSYEEKVYDQSINSWRILVRWMEPYAQAPDLTEEIPGHG